MVIPYLARGGGRGTAYPSMHNEVSKVEYNGGRRDHREGVYDDTRTRHTEEIALQGSYTLSCFLNR